MLSLGDKNKYHNIFDQMKDQVTFTHCVTFYCSAAFKNQEKTTIMLYYNILMSKIGDDI